MRMTNVTTTALALVVSLSGLAAAELPGRIPPGEGLRLVKPLPPGEPPPVAAANVSPIIYLERCKGGCTIRTGVNDARTLSSSIPDQPGAHYLSEFENAAGEVGAAADAEWNELVQCVKEVYSPFGAVVTDVKPSGNTSYHVDVVAGQAPQLGLSGSILGISPGVSCNPADNYVTFSFANAHGGSGRRRIEHLCWTVAQETAHTYGLDHSFKFGMKSACYDPMTYQTDCGGQKFFRNEAATCGEYAPAACGCGGQQNSHLHLLAIFGPGTPLYDKPALTVNAPVAGSTITNSTPIMATASSQRGVRFVEIWLNGYMWKRIDGAPFGRDGQPETMYSTPLPQGVPDGVIDIVIKAMDDIDATTESPPIRVTKGAPCTSADTCAAGQVCDGEGRCVWEPATGELGDTCAFPQFCLTEMCAGTNASDQRCTQECILGVNDSCPSNFSCIENGGPNKGICWPAGADDEDGGICSAGNGPASQASLLLLGLTALLITRRRR